jgi:aspartate aminotransferase
LTVPGRRLSARAATLKASETLALSARARELQARGEAVISFAAGEPDFPTPVHIQDAAIEAIRAGHHRYTAVAGVLELRTAIAEKLAKDSGVPYRPGQIVVGNGAKHAIWNALLALTEPGDEVLCPVPYWVSFPEMARLAGGTPVAVPPRPGTYTIGPEELTRALTPRARILILNSPNNPSGAVYRREELVALACVARRAGLFVLCDEIYESLIYGDAAHVSYVSLHPDHPDRTLLVGGVSKTWAMTGWRIGYVAAPPDIADGIERIQGQSTSNPSAVSQQAALRALTGDPEPARAMRERFARRRAYVVERFTRIPGVRLVPPDGAFYVFPDCTERIQASRIPGVRDSADLCNYLIDEAKVVCVPGSAFGMEGHLRCSYAAGDEQIAEGMDRIERALMRL